MRRTFLIASVAAAGVLAGGLLLMRNRSESPSPVVASPPAAPSAARNAPPRVPSAAAPAPAPDRPVARRSPAKAAIAPKPSGAADPGSTATLVVRSDVPGAQVFLDREFIGAAPITARDVKPGAHQLNVSAPGFEAHVETIDVSPGE